MSEVAGEVASATLFFSRVSSATASATEEAARLTTTSTPSRSYHCLAMFRACQFLSSVWLLDPVHRGGHAEHPHEGARRFLVAGGDSAPLFEPRPETLDPIAVVVDPWGTGDVGFVALGRDRRAGAKVPDPRFQMRSRKAWLA